MRVDTSTNGPTSVALIELGETPARDAVALANELLPQRGAVLFRGAAAASAADFHDIVNCFGAPFTEYLHGNSPRTAVHEGVWTSTEYPAEYDISMHNELSQSAIWPDRLFFCCLVAAKTGGETPVSDGRAMVADLDPVVRERFESRGVAYLQSMHGGLGLGRSWMETYETDDRDKVEELLRGAGVQFTWTEDADLRIRQVRPATRTHPLTGEEVWFNQAEQWHVSSLPGDQGKELLAMVESDEELPLHATFGDGSPISSADLDHVRAVAKQNECAIPWQAGDVLMIDNMLVMHGRRAFTGARQILVAMV